MGPINILSLSLEADLLLFVSRHAGERKIRIPCLNQHHRSSAFLLMCVFLGLIPPAVFCRSGKKWRQVDLRQRDTQKQQNLPLLRERNKDGRGKKKTREGLNKNKGFLFPSSFSPSLSLPQERRGSKFKFLMHGGAAIPSFGPSFLHFLHICRCAAERQEKMGQKFIFYIHLLCSLLLWTGEENPSLFPGRFIPFFDHLGGGEGQLSPIESHSLWRVFYESP